MLNKNSTRRDFVKSTAGLAVAGAVPYFFSQPRTFADETKSQNERKAHWANFFYCCRERKDPISDVYSHMQMLNICHLAGITARLGRPIN